MTSCKVESSQYQVSSKRRLAGNTRGGGGGSSRRAGSVGQLDPNCECKLVGDDGAEVRTGEPGELVVRGPNVCMGYWRNEGATREAIDAEGWLRTGDVAVCDSEGFFWIVDRKKVSTYSSTHTSLLLLLAYIYIYIYAREQSLEGI